MELNCVEFALGESRVRVDAERTRAYYDAHAALSASCDCGYCRNYRAACSGIPKEAEGLLDQLGLTLTRPAEIMEWCREADGRHWDTIQYHVAGELLAQGRAPVEIAPEVTVGFTKDSGPFLEGFPEPFFQVFLDLRLPWLLEEPED